MKRFYCQRTYGPYKRKDKRKQPIAFLDFRNHINSRIHEIQDYLHEAINVKTYNNELALMVGMSPRHLTRVFKEVTGITINEYLTKIRLETARMLLKNPGNTMSVVARKCGFKTERQLQRILKN